MNRKKYLLLAVSTITVCLCVFCSLLPQHVFASSESGILKKALLRGLNTCYSDKYMKKEIPEEDFSGISSLMTSDGKADGTIKLPTSVGNTISDADISCEQLFNGYSGFGGKVSGLISLTGKPVTKDTITQMGYKAITGSGGSGDKGCVSFEYTYVKDGRQTDPVSTNQLCFKINPSDNKIEEIITDSSMTFTTPLYLINNDGYSMSISGDGLDSNMFSVMYYNQDWDTFASNFATNASNVNGWRMCNADYDESCKNKTYGYSSYHAEKEGGGMITYQKDNYTTAATAALRYFTGNNSASFSDSDYKYSLDDQYTLAKSYVDDYIKSGQLVLGSTSECSTDLATAKEKTGYAIRDGEKWCPVSGVDSISGDFNVINSNLTSMSTVGFDGVMTNLMSINYEKLEEEGVHVGGALDPVTGGNPTTGDPSGTDTSETPLCTQASGVLSWFFCPVLNFMGEVVGDLYEWIEDSFLVIPATVMDPSNKTHYGWSQFRNFANILFAVLFAVVILSQITGVGISNYNIKKMLPRLIAIVVLVNVSFILCQLLVDVSNIVGRGVNDMFTKMAGGENAFNLGSITELTSELVSGTESGVQSALGGFGVGLAVVAGIATWKLWLLPLFLAIIGALVAVFFFFLTLGIRQAGVIIMVVLAPLAIVCYALPNTKSIFDKWWKLFSALLLVYPICGALMGGGKFAATILISYDETSFLYFIVAMLLTIVPFFFVPTVLKNSLNGIANLGNKLSTMGSRAGRSAQGAVAHTRRFQDMDNRLKVSRATSAANRHAFLANTRVGKGLASVNQSLNKFGNSKPTGNAAQRLGGRAIRSVARTLAAPGNASQRIYAQNQHLAMGGRREQARANNINAELAGEDARQERMNIDNARALYGQKTETADKQPFDIGNVDQVNTDFEESLAALAHDPTDERALANAVMQAEVLGETDDGTARMMSTLTSMAAEHPEMRDAVQQVSKRLDPNKYKNKNRNFFKTLNDFRSGRFDGVVDQNGHSTLGQYTVGEGDKAKTYSYAKSYNRTSGGIKYSAAGFASLDDSAYNQLLTDVSNGNISGERLQDLMGVVNEAMSSDTISMDTNASSFARKILSAGYAQQNSIATQGGAPRTAGSHAISHAASPKTIQRLTQSVQSGTDVEAGGISTTDAVNIANNMLTSVRDNTNSFEPAQLEAMKNYVSAVNQRGTDDNGQPINFDTREFDSAQINVHGGKVQPTSEPTPAAPGSSNVITTRQGTVSGTQIIDTPTPSGEVRTEVRGWSGGKIGGGDTRTEGGIILEGSAAEAYRRERQAGQNGGNQNNQQNNNP